MISTMKFLNAQSYHGIEDFNTRLEICDGNIPLISSINFLSLNIYSHCALQNLKINMYSTLMYMYIVKKNYLHRYYSVQMSPLKIQHMYVLFSYFRPCDIKKTNLP